MSTPVEPLRLLLLADEPEWAALLHACMPALGGSAVLLTAPNWEAVDSLFSHDRQAVVLATPGLQPAAGRCELPTILLLDHEPEAAPSAVSDWLVRDQLSADTLRRSLRHVRERGVLVATLQ
ncbi:MAG: GGDEF-domain containing protein, partial [Pseudomonas alloputida]